MTAGTIIYKIRNDSVGIRLAGTLRTRFGHMVHISERIDKSSLTLGKETPHGSQRTQALAAGQRVIRYGLSIVHPDDF